MRLSEVEHRFLTSLSLISGLCLVLLGLRIAVTGTFHYSFLAENLILAWLPFVFALILSKNLPQRGWRNWQNITLSILWFLFLPNSWYVLTDFIHVKPTGEISQLYDITMVIMLVIDGFILGFASLYLFHKQFQQRLSSRTSWMFVLLIILAASFAIYVGRDLRWNSWDIVANPSGLILGVTDRLIDPFGHPRALNITGIFFILISGLYLAVWNLLRPLKKSRSK